MAVPGLKVQVSVHGTMHSPKYTHFGVGSSCCTLYAPWHVYVWAALYRRKRLLKKIGIAKQGSNYFFERKSGTQLNFSTKSIEFLIFRFASRFVPLSTSISSSNELGFRFTDLGFAFIWILGYRGRVGGGGGSAGRGIVGRWPLRGILIGGSWWASRFGGSTGKKAMWHWGGGGRGVTDEEGETTANEVRTYLCMYLFWRGV